MKVSQGFIGVLMLDTALPRPLGDAGNVDSYSLPARIRVVPDAGSLDIVQDGLPEEHIVQGFIAAAKELEADGARTIVSTCGFLISVQQRIAASVSVPVMLSALSLVPLVRTFHGSRPIGILVASAGLLGTDKLKAAGIASGDVRISGLQDCHAFADAILCPKDQQPTALDETAIRAAVVAKAQALCAGTPDLAAFVFECGNLPPYAAAVEAATGLPVYSILDGARFMMARRAGA